MIFQHRCRVKVEPEDLQFAREAMCTPGMVTPGEDIVLGEATLWDGSVISIQLRGVPEKPAVMIAGVFDCAGNFLGAAQSTTYCNGFDFDANGISYMASMYTEKALDQEKSGPAEKTPPRSMRGQER